MDDNYIQTQLQKFDFKEAMAAQLHQRFKDLRIKHIDDVDGYKQVSAARKEMKGYRVDVEKRRKELNEGALTYQRAINAEAKRITALLEPIENYLEAQEKEHARKLEEHKQEQIKLFEEKCRYRIQLLREMEFTFDGVIAIAPFKTEGDKFFTIPIKELNITSQPQFEILYNGLKFTYEIFVKERKAEQEQQRAEAARILAERNAEIQRLAQQKKEQDEIARQQKQKEEELTKKRIELEKAIREKKLAEEEEARKKAIAEVVETERTLIEVSKFGNPNETIVLSIDEKQNSVIDQVEDKKLQETQRGFKYYKFTDRYGKPCILQESSLATEDCVWLGIDEPQARMHLTKEMAQYLINHLLYFVGTGEL